MTSSGQGCAAFPRPNTLDYRHHSTTLLGCQLITHEQLKSAIHYDPATGIFKWLTDKRHGRNNAFLARKSGEIAGFRGSHGYWYIVIDQLRHAAHRWAWFYMTGTFPSKEQDIDHINGTRDDNRWPNLRLVTRSENMQNLKGPHKDNSTGFLGVEKKRNKFSARICIDGHKRSLGSFYTAQEAHQAYLTEKRKIHGKGTL